MIKKKILLSIIITLVSIILFCIEKLVFSSSISHSVIIIQSLIIGAFYGFILNGVFNKIGSSLNNNNRYESYNTKENLIFVSKSNIKKNLFINGGKLFITKEHLSFRGHKLNLKDIETIININDIKNIEKTKLFFILDMGLKVNSINNESVVFYLDDRDKAYSILETLLFTTN